MLYSKSQLILVRYYKKWRSLSAISLFYRQRVIQQNRDLRIEDIVRFAGIVAPKANRTELQKYLTEFCDNAPLLYTLWCENRVLMGKIGKDSDYIADKLKSLNSLTDMLEMVRVNSVKSLTTGLENTFDQDKRETESEYASKTFRVNELCNEAASLETSKPQTHLKTIESNSEFDREQTRRLKAEADLVEQQVLKAQLEAEKVNEERKKITDERLQAKYHFLKSNGRVKEAEELMEFILDLN